MYYVPVLARSCLPAGLKDESIFCRRFRALTRSLGRGHDETIAWIN